MTALACIVLAATALVHVLPVLGVLGGARLQSLYGISAADPGVGLLLQHRAVLFGIVAAICAAGAIWAPLRVTALAVGVVSTWSYVVLWRLVGARSAPLDRIAYVDICLGPT